MQTLDLREKPFAPVSYTSLTRVARAVAISETDSTRTAAATDAECRALVERIAASREFRRAARLRDFLAYVVERQLAGCRDEITEYHIGRRVFGRPESYNPGEDSIVRTEARTLRQRLDRYFSGEGSGEPLILEIPRGGYLPVFHPRQPEAGLQASPAAPIPAPGMSRRRWLGIGALGTAGGALLWRSRPSRRAETITPRAVPPVPGQVRFESASRGLDRAFEYARQRAMSCVYTGDPVGDWYATMPAGQSDVFCMRDVSHQSAGAAVLGLTRHAANMLRAFARSIARSRDWCGYWVITKDGFPAPSNYNNDDDFGYGLPANFDVMRACYRQLMWTGDKDYLDDVFSTFYTRTVTDYVERWDAEHGGIMENARRPRIRASYHASGPRLLTGADLLAAQYAGYLTFAAIQELKGGEGSLSQRLALEYRDKARALGARFNREWWNAAENRFYSGILMDRSFDPEDVPECNMYALWFGIPQEGPKAAAALDRLAAQPPQEPQARSYSPEILYEYGRYESAYASLLEIGNPDFFGHQVAAEVSFAVIGAVAGGLMGIAPNRPAALVATRPRLTPALEWARLAHVPAGPNILTVEHRGARETTLTNQSGPALRWKASFDEAPPETGRLLVDDVPAPSFAETAPHQQVVRSVLVTMRPGQTRTVRLV